MVSRVESPLPLALLRIVVPLVILFSPELHAGRALIASPERLGFVPEGLGLVSRLPLGPDAVRVLQILAFTSCATAILGFASRASMLVLTLSAGLVFSLSQRQGAVIHDMHLLWLTALLAASPCGEAWSLDAWGKSRPAASVCFGVPLALARLLLGLVYLFPGIHKLRVSGLAWIGADNVIGHMRAKWLEHGHVPSARIDHAPLLCAIGAAFVIAFELSFVVLASVSVRTRWVALAAGLSFHAATQVLFFIPFVSLWACYVVLLDGARLERAEDWVRERAKAPPLARTETSGKMPAAAIAVGAILVLAVVVQGARGVTQAWPFACYPTFSHLQANAIPDIVVEVERRGATTVRLTGREIAVRSQDEWGRVFRLSGAYGDVPEESALRDHARRVVLGATLVPSDAVRVRLYRVEVATEPSRWGEPPAGGVLIRELPGPL